jgi:hypothetical protein
MLLQIQLNFDFSSVRQQLWRGHAAMRTSLRVLQRSQSMVQGSFYLLHRKCGKPNCRCARGELHASWVITRSQLGKDRIYTVPAEERGRLRELTTEYRRYQRARAVLVKRHLQLLKLADLIAEKRLLPWPERPAR